MKIPDYQIRVLEKEVISCKDFRDLLGDYAEGEVTESLMARLDNHIEQCQYCQDLRHGYFKVIELAKELRPKQMPDDAKKRLRETLNARLGLSLPTA